MLLSVFSRHSSDCKYAADRAFRRCNCPKWIGGQVNREYFRKSAGTRQWNEAEEYRLKLEDALVKGLPPFGPVPDSAMPSVSVPAPEAPPALPVALRPEEISAAKPEKPRVTVEAAVEAYLADARSRELESSTLSKLDTIFRKQLLAWSKVQGLDYLDQIDLDVLLSFRSTWADGRLAKQKKQSRLIGFFWACVRRGYIAQNPSMGLGKIKVVQVPTDYFPRDEFQRILDATYIYGDPRGGVIDVQAIRSRLRTMTLLMRWSGLRIRDAVTLERDRLHGDSLMLYQAKTGTPVYVPLPPHVIEALQNIPPGPKPNPRYFFWSGNGQPKSVVADWQRSYRRLFKLVNLTLPDGSIKRCHPHMFRDTFAVEMLLAGVPIDQVSLLLGHASVKITEKSYSPFVKARQVQLQESVRNAWRVGQTPHPGPENSPPNTASLNQAKSGWQLIRSADRPKVDEERTTAGGDPQPQTAFHVDEVKAAQHGIAVSDVTHALALVTSGTQVGLIHDQVTRVPVPAIVELDRADRSSEQGLENIRLPGADGGMVSLRELVSVAHETIQPSIYHKNLHRVVYVTGDVAGAEESPVYAILKMNQALDHLTLPAGYTLARYNSAMPESTDHYSMKWDGEWHITIEVFRDMGLAFAAVLILIYVLVVGWFRSFIVPLIIMAPIPLTLVGIMPAHAMLGAFFTATSMIGFIAGAGIIVRNSIILVDFIELRIREGMPLAEAVIDAGATRFRPMLLTAAAVVVGASVILTDPIFQGLALSLIAGAVASTFLSWPTIPVLYYMVHARDESTTDASNDAA